MTMFAVALGLLANTFAFITVHTLRLQCFGLARPSKEWKERARVGQKVSTGRSAHISLKSAAPISRMASAGRATAPATAPATVETHP